MNELTLDETLERIAELQDEIDDKDKEIHYLMWEIAYLEDALAEASDKLDAKE